MKKILILIVGICLAKLLLVPRKNANLELTPQQRRISEWVTQGVALAAEGQTEEAEKSFLNAISLADEHDPGHPELPNALENLALVCRSQGRDSEAADFYERCLNLLDRAGDALRSIRFDTSHRETRSQSEKQIALASEFDGVGLSWQPGPRHQI